MDEGVLRELISSPVKAVMKIYSEWMKIQQNYMGLAIAVSAGIGTHLELPLVIW